MAIIIILCRTRAVKRVQYGHLPMRNWRISLSGNTEGSYSLKMFVYVLFYEFN